MPKLNYLLPVTLLTSISFIFVTSNLSKAQVSQKDKQFLSEVENYAQERNITFTDVSDKRNIETAKKLCTGIQKRGLSNAFEKFVSVTNKPAEQESLGYFFW